MQCTVCDSKPDVGSLCYTTYKTFTCGPCNHVFAAPQDQSAQYRGLIDGKHIFRYYHSVHCPSCHKRIYILAIDCDEFNFGDEPIEPSPVTPEEIEWLFSPERPRITIFQDS